jgi:HlyD family secretion protein
VPSKAEFAAGQAAVARAQADEASAQAEVVAARAAVTTDETNLSKGSIRSPIDGVVLSRTVEPGNAVAASLQAVTLFTLAEDLSKLKLQVNVDEADVGSVQVGQKSNFTVSAYPSRKYPAVVNRVAFGSTITENVVTYVTYLDVDNSDLSLRPGMTASATIYAIEHHDAILVPNTALRFTPTRGIGGSKPSDGLVSSLLPRMPRSGPVKSTSTTGPARRVWVLRDGKAVDIPITTGISDGRMTEVTVGELESGMLVITDQRNAGSSP